MALQLDKSLQGGALTYSYQGKVYADITYDAKAESAIGYGLYIVEFGFSETRGAYASLDAAEYFVLAEVTEQLHNDVG